MSSGPLDSPADDLLKCHDVVQVLMREEGQTLQFLPDGVESVTDSHGVHLGLKASCYREK